MPQHRFEFANRWTVLHETISQLLHALAPEQRDVVEEIFVLLEDNHADLETYLNGRGVDVAAFTALNYGVPPEGNNKWQVQFGRNVIDLSFSHHTGFPVPFDNGGLLNVTLADDPANGAVIAPVEASVNATGFDTNVYVGGVAQTTGLYALNWILIGW